MKAHYYDKRLKTFVIYNDHGNSYTEYYNDHGTWRKMPGMKRVDGITHSLIESLMMTKSKQ